MTERTAAALGRAKDSDTTAEEAWDELQQLADDVDWDVERMLDERTPSDSELETPGRGD